MLPDRLTIGCICGSFGLMLVWFSGFFGTAASVVTIRGVLFHNEIGSGALFSFD